MKNLILIALLSGLTMHIAYAGKKDAEKEIAYTAIREKAANNGFITTLGGIGLAAMIGGMVHGNEGAALGLGFGIAASIVSGGNNCAKSAALQVYDPEVSFGSLCYDQQFGLARQSAALTAAGIALIIWLL
jgi:hypothetical protein